MKPQAKAPSLDFPHVHSVAREVVSSSTSGNFGGQKESILPMWNRGGIVCLHNDAKALIEGTASGNHEGKAGFQFRVVRLRNKATHGHAHRFLS